VRYRRQKQRIEKVTHHHSLKIKLCGCALAHITNIYLVRSSYKLHRIEIRKTNLHCKRAVFESSDVRVYQSTLINDLVHLSFRRKIKQNEISRRHQIIRIIQHQHNSAIDYKVEARSIPYTTNSRTFRPHRQSLYVGKLLIKTFHFIDSSLRTATFPLAFVPHSLSYTPNNVSIVPFLMANRLDFRPTTTTQET
jgi:hypothetical protein